MPKSVYTMCGGTGRVTAETVEQCYTCNGSGQIYKGGGVHYTCYSCDGKGSKRFIREVLCGWCSGLGHKNY